MLTEPQLIACVEGTLPPDERAEVEAALAQDGALRRRVVEQMRLDAALRATLGGAKANERVKQSVLAVLRGESEAVIKRQVLEDTTHLRRPAVALKAEGNSPVRVASPHPGLLPSGEGETHPASFLKDALVMFRRWLTGSLSLGERAGVRGSWRYARRGRVLAGAAACLILVLGAWLIFRSDTTKPAGLTALETPQRVAFPDGTEMFPRPGTKIEFDRRAGSFTPQPGDGLRIGDSGSGTMAYGDGTVLHLEPGTEVRFVAAASPARTGGKQFTLVRGALSADVAKQPVTLPLLIHTPHAVITVVGTEFDLAAGTNATQLEVTHGLVKMSGTNTAASVEVAAGEIAVASPDAPPRTMRLARDPYRWPFRSDSPWNTPLGSGAKYEPLPGKPLLADGPLLDALRPRRPFMGGPAQPLRGVWINGERRADVRFADSFTLPNTARDSIVLLQSGRRFALELRGVTTRAGGDLNAEAMERIDLAGSGLVPTPNAAVPFGWSALGGLLRAGERDTGIRHALAARVPRERLGGRRDLATPSTVWPATGGDAAGEAFLNVGTLLALPPDVDIRPLAGDSGPAYELARALQDYGVYVTGSINAPFALLTDGLEPGASEFDALLNRLVPLLQVVRNNSPQTPGGGGEPRRPSAPPFPNETR